METGKESAKILQKKVNPDGEVWVDAKKELEGIQKSRNIMCKDMKLIKNTCFRDLKEVCMAWGQR